MCIADLGDEEVRCTIRCIRLRNVDDCYVGEASPNEAKANSRSWELITLDSHGDAEVVGSYDNWSDCHIAQYDRFGTSKHYECVGNGTKEMRALDVKLLKERR